MYHIACLAFGDLNIYQLYQLMRLRQEVFVVEQECAYLDADGHDTKGWHVLGYDDSSSIVAYARILPSGTSYDDFLSIGRVLTQENARGNGYARLIMKKSIEFIEEQFGMQPIKLSAQSYLIEFYKTLGFQPIGTEYLEDGIPHMAMIRDSQPK
ncbi:MAG: GNAT family N-acetyltransferase [Saprospiraceae bacterium]|nr:GNAT family N-acetyltransferase [Saprospiraceae bacterium]